MKGRFISFEGGEGAGKSTQVALLAETLRARGRDVVITREPGGTAGAEAIRSLLIHGEANRWDAWSEALLVYAARRDHVCRVIQPAVMEGKWVLCDRFSDSTMAYQGVAGGVGVAAIETLHRLVLGRFVPDVTLVLDLPPEQGLARAAARRAGGTRFESLDISFHHKLRTAFLSIATADKERCALVNALQSPDAVAHDIITALQERHAL